MTLGYWILRLLSRSPDLPDYNLQSPSYREGETLTLLEGEFENFSSIVQGKRVLDFGCGFGHQVIALAEKYYSEAVGIDTNSSLLPNAVKEAKSRGVNCVFFQSMNDELRETFDVVISQNSMEHFPSPLDTLRSMVSLVKPRGLLLITFAPPWYAPYGSHMHFFCRVPWLQLLFSENTIMKVRSLYRDDGATHFDEVDSGLNKMSLNKFENLIHDIPVKLIYRRYHGVKGFDFVSNMPVVRELFVNRVSVILQKTE